jgi:hypothetical protein
MRIIEQELKPEFSGSNENGDRYIVERVTKETDEGILSKSVQVSYIPAGETVASRTFDDASEEGEFTRYGEAQILGFFDPENREHCYLMRSRTTGLQFGKNSFSDDQLIPLKNITDEDLAQTL